MNHMLKGYLVFEMLNASVLIWINIKHRLYNIGIQIWWMAYLNSWIDTCLSYLHSNRKRTELKIQIDLSIWVKVPRSLPCQLLHYIFGTCLIIPICPLWKIMCVYSNQMSTRTDECVDWLHTDVVAYVHLFLHLWIWMQSL